MFITRKFIEKVHEAFDELNYHETKQLDFDRFEKEATRTLTLAKDLSDAIDVIRMYQFCLKKWGKIEYLFKKKLHIFNEYQYEGNALIEIVTDEDSLGTYYITNGINNKIKDIVVASSLFEDKMFAFGLNNGKFTVFEDGDYYIKDSKMSSVKMKLFNKKNDCLCNIVLSENLGIFLENNKTQYELVVYDDFIGIYDKDYINSLSETDIIDTNKLLADIEWDILKKKSQLGVSKLNVYENDVDLEMLLLFASTTFLIFQKYMRAEKNKNILFMSCWAQRR